MLQAPAYAQYDGVTVFADDALFYKFYPIPQYPNIRLDKNGKPTFLLVKYALSDEDRLRDPSLPAGGGYLTFDVEFSVPPATLEKVRKQLQEDVDARWQRYKNGTPQEQALPGVAGTTQPPQVEFGEPTWTGGKVALDAPQTTQLVSARVVEGEPSVLTGNIAVFNMDLTPAGATFMEKTLVNPGGAGATDLIPIQVRYDLQFWARLPPVRIHVKADSERIYQYTHKIMLGRGIDYCTTYDFEHTDIDEETLEMSGAIDVQIDTGSGSLPEDVISELRRYSLELVKQMIQSSFFTTVPGSAGTEGEPPELALGESPKKYLKQSFDKTTMSIEFNLEQRTVIEWQIHPRATLETFFKGMAAEELKEYVRPLALRDPFFQNLALSVRAFTDFEDSQIGFLEVQVHYEGADENGVFQEKNNTFTFDSPEPQTWAPSLIGSQRKYQYRYRVGFTGQAPGEFTEWVSEKSPDLNISVPSPGKIDLIVLAGDVDFENLVSQVQVQLAYEDSEIGVPRAEQTVVLRPTTQEGHYQRMIFQPRRKPINYRARFNLKSGEVREEEWAEATGDQIVINQPVTDVLRVSLLPTGNGWEDVLLVPVTLKYQDMANQYTVEETILLKSRDEFKTWKVYLKNKALRDFQYRWDASYKNGHLEQSGWKSASDSLPVPIVVQRQGLQVLLLADANDFTICPQIEVHCRYSAAGMNEQETFLFRDKSPQTWHIDVPPGAPVEYSVEVTYHPAGLDPITLPLQTEKDTVFVVPPFRAARAGQLMVQVFATLVDFAATPIVAMDLRYDDDEQQVHEVGALTFTASDPKTQTWIVAVKNTNLKRFSYKLTYFTPDGVDHSQDAHTQDVPRIIIPKFGA